MEVDPDTEALAAEIVSYLKRNPDAADTREHIERWWLAAQRIEHALALTAQALNLLERRGVVERFAVGSEVAYRLRAGVTPVPNSPQHN